MTMPFRKHVVCLVGTSGYGVLSHLTNDLARAFLAKGWTAETLDLTRIALPTEMRRLEFEGGVGFFCGYSGYGSNIMLGDGRLLYDVLGVPYIGLMLDNPCYFPARHFIDSQQLVYLHGDDGHHAVSTEISPAGSRRDLFRLAAAPEPRPIPLLVDRDIPALFASKGGDPAAYAREIDARYKRPERAFIHDVADAAGARQHARVWELAMERRSTGVEREAAGQSEQFHSLVLRADHLARLRRATEVARSLLTLPVQFVGGAWAHIQSPGTRATFRPGASLPELRSLMLRSQVVLNVQPHTTDSLHDRLLFGMHAGAAVVSDSNAFIDAHVGAHAFHKWAMTGPSAADVIAGVIARPRDSQPTADRGLVVARERYSMGALAAQLLSIGEANRAVSCTNAA